MTTLSSQKAATATLASPVPKVVGGAGSSSRLPKGWLGFPIRAWVMAGFLAIAFGVLYRSSLLRLWLKTNPYDGVSEWAHAVFVPIIGICYLYLNIDDLLKAKVKPLLGIDFTARRFASAAIASLIGLALWKVLPLVSAHGPSILAGPINNYAGELGTLGMGLLALGVFAALFDWGVGTLLFGLLTYGYGIWPGSNDFVKDIGMVMTVFGTVLTIAGWQVMRIAWFPCVFLLCALPWPGLFYSKAAMPMQQLSAQVAVVVMQVFGVDVENNGTQIMINKGLAQPRVLNVAEACAGLKMLMTFVTMGVSIAFLSARPMWQRLVISASAIPVAILCNAARVSGQGLLDYYVSEKWSSGFAHQFAGIVMVLPGFAILLLIGWVLDKLFIEVDDTHHPAAVTGKIGGAA